MNILMAIEYGSIQSSGLQIYRIVNSVDILLSYDLNFPETYSKH